MENCHADADYFITHSTPVVVGQTKIAGLHVYQQRINRMLEVLLHDNRSISQWKSMDVREKILNTFEVSESEYSRNQDIYDIRKLRAHGLVEKLHRSNRYRLTSYGVKVALAFTLMRPPASGTANGFMARCIIVYFMNNPIKISSAEVNLSVCTGDWMTTSMRYRNTCLGETPPEAKEALKKS